MLKVDKAEIVIDEGAKGYRVVLEYKLPPHDELTSYALQPDEVVQFVLDQAAKLAKKLPNPYIREKEDNIKLRQKIEDMEKEIEDLKRYKHAVELSPVRGTLEE